MINLKKKIELSNILEKIEIDGHSLENIKLLDNLHSKPKSHVLGITGPPGAGKSSLIDKLIAIIRKKKKTVGVIAIDPSSSKSGGALLGDRTRFQLDPSDGGVYVRSMAAKDYLGGVSELTYPTMTVMRSKFDFLIIETVGVGQSETSIKDIVDTVILCVQPGSGDTIQFMKSGIFEIPDLVVVTKCDMEKLSNQTFSDLSGSSNYFKNKNEWDIKIILTSSHKNIGLNSLEKDIENRWKWLIKEDRLNKNRYSQDIEWMKNSIIREFGLAGFKKGFEKINYKKNPFSELARISKVLKS
jgi:LAO/AO transport system kinase